VPAVRLGRVAMKAPPWEGLGRSAMGVGEVFGGSDKN